jgi:hypothetical protein
VAWRVDLELEVSSSDVQRIEVGVVAMAVLQSIFSNFFQDSLPCALDVVLVAHVVSDKAAVE